MSTDLDLDEKMEEVSEQISYWDSIFILVSVAFGLGYIDMLSTGDILHPFVPLLIFLLNFIVGFVSTYFLATVKNNLAFNRMGSY